MDNGTANDLQLEAEIKCEMICEEDIKTEIFDNFAAEHDEYDLKVEEYYATDFETSIKIEDVTSSGDITDVSKKGNIKRQQSCSNTSSQYAPLNKSSVPTEPKRKKPRKRKRKSTDNKTSRSRDKGKRKRREDITFACGFCAKTFPKSKHFFSHMKFHRDGFKNNNREIDNVSNTEIKCEKNTSGTDVTKSKINKRNKHNETFQCDQCAQTFTFKNNLKRHILLHGGKRPVCDICKKSYNKKDYLVQHIKNVHLKLKDKNDTVFACKVCKKTVTTAYALRCHMQIHTGKKPFQCNFCMKGYSNKWNLKVHLKSYHEG